MDPAAVVLMALTLGAAVVAVFWTTGSERSVYGHAECDGTSGLSSMRDLEFDRPPPEPDASLVRVYDVDRLLDVDHFRGMDAVEALMKRLVAEVAFLENAGPRQRPRPPTAVLMHGPPGVGMPVLAHLFARRSHARLVHLFASRAVPATNGGSQPLIAAAVSHARYHLPSVLFIDELEMLAAAEIQDAKKKRAAHDIIGEGLRSTYGPSYVVLAAFTIDHSSHIRKTLSRLFDMTISVNVPEFELAMAREAIRMTGHPIFEILSAQRLLKRVDVRRETPIESAA